MEPILQLYDVVIVGGGPAGLTAGIYAARARLKTLLIESYSLPTQAVVASQIENYPGFPEGISGPRLIKNFKQQAKKFAVEVKQGMVKSIKPAVFAENKGWQIVIEDKIYTSLCLIIASGAHPKELGLKSERKFRGRGVSYCGVCDAPFFKDKEIAVIGGGNAAIEEALFLCKFVSKINLIHRRKELRATKILQERLFREQKINFIQDSIVKEILGKQKIEAVRIANVKTGQEKDIACSGVFIFVGSLPNTDFAKDIVQLDEKGYIIVNDKMETSNKGIFACGDCRKSTLKQIITACGDGAFAAFSAQQYIEAASYRLQDASKKD